MTTADLFETTVAHHHQRRSFGWLRRLWTAFKRGRAERKLVMTLSQLDERLLHDIGVEPQDVIAALNGRSAPSILFNPMRRQFDHE